MNAVLSRPEDLSKIREAAESKLRKKKERLRFPTALLRLLGCEWPRHKTSGSPSSAWDLGVKIGGGGGVLCRSKVPFGRSKLKKSGSQAAAPQ